MQGNAYAVLQHTLKATCIAAAILQQDVHGHKQGMGKVLQG